MARETSSDAEHERAMAKVERAVAIVRGVAVVLVLTGAAVGIVALRKFGRDTSDLASLGSFLQGTVGALWGLAGLTLVYVAFLGQQLQILQQKADLSLARQAFQEQRQEMKTQTELFDNQRFETTFFALLSSHLDLVNNMEIDVGNGPSRGPRAFETVLARISAQFANAVRDDPVTPSLEIARQVYLEYYRRFEQVLGPYFHGLFHILKFVDDRPLPVDRQFERRRYTNFVRARLSISELLLLFYSGISEQAAGMRSLIERYSILKHLSTSRLFDREHRLAYNASAWARPMNPQSADKTNEHRARKRRRVPGQTAETRLPGQTLSGAAAETLSGTLHEAAGQPVGETLSEARGGTLELGRQASNLQPPG